MSKKDPNIEETLALLTELAERQQTALDMANDLLSMKSKLIELCEEELNSYKSHCKSLHIISLSLCALLALSAFIHIIR